MKAEELRASGLSEEEARADVTRLNERGVGEPPELIPAGSLARSLARFHGDEARGFIDQGDAESAYRAARLAALEERLQTHPPGGS